MSIAVEHRTHVHGSARSAPVVALSAERRPGAEVVPSGSVITLLDASMGVVTISASGRFHEGRNTTFSFSVTTEEQGDAQFTCSNDSHMRIAASGGRGARNGGTHDFTVTVPSTPGCLSYVARLTSRVPITSLTHPAPINPAT